jgi:acetylornithine deacetylase/succinyl-diaminopimelate desuccinylase-like protein
MMTTAFTRRRVALLATALLLAPTVQAQDRPPRTRWETQARAFLKELTEINTTHSVGDSHAAAEAMAKRMREAGWPAQDVIVVKNAERKGNLIVRYRGRNPAKKGVLLLSHLDVVEADPKDWTLPPFQFIEKDGIFYGRGVADDKDEGAMHLTILLRMKAEGFVPERDIVVALTADEEGGPQNGVDYILKQRPELFANVEFGFNEGGAGRVEGGKRISNDVQASEKKVANFTIEATNSGGHSSVPRPDNAIYQLSAALTRIGAYHFPVKLNEVTREYFRRQAALVSPEVSAAMRRIVANDRDSAAAALIARDPSNNSRLRTTCVATMLTGGHAENALPQRATATVNCRILPDESTDQTRARLIAAVNDTGVTVTVKRGAADSPPSPLEASLLRTMEQTTQELWPGIPVIPTMSTGATDAVYLRNAGIPVYGVSGLFYDGPNAHGMNEHISAAAFYDGLEFMYRVVKRVTAGPNM